jgi:hypothetical protein
MQVVAEKFFRRIGRSSVPVPPTASVAMAEGQSDKYGEVNGLPSYSLECKPG